MGGGWGSQSWASGERSDAVNLKSRRLGVTAHAVMFLAGCALVITRRPDAVFGAQFYAEDGRVWYQDAFEVGARSLLFPAGGYLNTLSRLIAMVAQLAHEFEWMRAPSA